MKKLIAEIASFLGEPEPYEIERKYLIEYPDKTLIDISESVGYSDVYYFSKNFKKYYGISPSKYMEERKN